MEYADRGDERLRNDLVEAHLGLAHQLARRFTNRGEPYDDLVQVASLALVKSVDRFEPDRGVEFSTFATRTIIGELKRHFRDRGWAIRAPRRIQELYLAVRPAV
jgi:RNA polymerase sigma-B factor